MSYCMIYVTCSTKEEAEKILLTLLEGRLAACGNITAQITSYFHWDGKIDRAEEVVLIVKTTDEKFKAVETHVAELHSYDVPCILKLPITDIYGPYAEWMDQELSGK